MTDLKDEIDTLELSFIPISHHIHQLKESAPSIFCHKFIELEEKMTELKRIIGALRTCVMPMTKKNK